MKIIQKKILPFQENEYFIPIRDKIDYAKVIIFATRNLLINIDNNDFECFSSMKLLIDKMSRLFFYKEKKYFSISFPFTVQIDIENELTITTFSGKSITNKDLSNALAILNDANFRLNPSLLDFYIDSNDVESDGIALLEEIFQSEPAYIRYDNDPSNEDGKRHPLNHLDINYSSYGTYKIGLTENILDNFFEDALNTNTDCLFLSK